MMMPQRENPYPDKRRAIQLRDLANFNATQVLSNNAAAKKIVVLGNFKQDRTAPSIVILERTPFTPADVYTSGSLYVPGQDDELRIFVPEAKVRKLFSATMTLDKVFLNDIYGEYLLHPEENNVKVTVIRRCTAAHIDKYKYTGYAIVQETPEAYERITVPQLIQPKLSINWVYNILDHKKEKERIVYEDRDKTNGFILLPDSKWDGENKDTLHLLAICHRRDLRSLRSLDASHLPLLKNIRNASCAKIFAKYRIHWQSLRIYLHYQPTFYHLHVHFNLASYDGPGIFCEHSHLLNTVITNLEIDGNYYKKATLTFGLKSDHLYVRSYSDAFDHEMWEACKKLVKKHKNDEHVYGYVSIDKTLAENAKERTAEIEADMEKARIAAEAQKVIDDAAAQSSSTAAIEDIQLSKKQRTQ